MMPEEIQKKRSELEAEKKKLQEEVGGWESCRRSTVAEIEREYDYHHINPIKNRISAIEKELEELQQKEAERGKGREYISRYRCTVCGNDFENCDTFTTVSVPIFGRNASGKTERIGGWTYRIASCESCFEKYGKPIDVRVNGYGPTLASFEKSRERVELKGMHLED